jgi:predicted metal-dependent phosphoesterase TrpH
MTTLARNQVDLHSHTRRSDGVMEPADLYESAREYGMRLISITDHDTLAGYRALRDAGLGASAGESGPELLSGVEINTVSSSGWEGPEVGREELHILGLGVDPDDDEFENALQLQRERRRERIERLVTRLRELDMPVDAYLAETLPGSVASAGRPHVARAMVLAGYSSSLDEAMTAWLSPGSPGWVPRQGMDVRQAIAAIRRAGGLPSLAHFPYAPARLDLLRELRDLGLGGLEVHYRSFPPDVVVTMAQTAASLSLVPTGGSDYHGDAMTYAEAQDRTRVPLAVGERVLAAVTEGRARTTSLARVLD